jgi:hypothetical protein
MLTGLTSSATGESWWSEKARRRVFYQYPQGAAPLMGLLSMMDEQEVDKPKFSIFEERFENYCSKTAAYNSAGPFAAEDGTNLTTSGWSKSAGDTIKMKVTDGTKFRVRDVIEVLKMPSTTTAILKLIAVVETISTNTLTLKVLRGITNATNTTTSNGLIVQATGTASGEGVRSKTGQHARPFEVTNYTQIFRTPFHLTRNALKAGLRYDSSGEYKTKAKKNALRHSILLERSFFFGQRYEDTVVNEDGDTVPRRFMGGVEWYLRQWELGNISNGGAADYRANGSDVSTSDWATTDEKRICDVYGNMTGSQFEMLLERLFRFTNDTSYEKLGFCGGQFLRAFTQYVGSNHVVKREMFQVGKAGFECHEYETTFGSIYLKTHPLFNDNPALWNDCFFLDLADFTYTYFQDSDTELLKNRQLPDADYRKDEWMTECGLEVIMPEQNMIVRGVESIG